VLKNGKKGAEKWEKSYGNILGSRVVKNIPSIL
jgi:hypothetical protein